MSKNDKKTNRRSLQSSYLTSIISITLVLFLIGIMGFLILNARMINKAVRESIGFNIILKENVKDADILRLQKILDSKSYTLSTNFITREAAALETEQLVGENFVEFLGYNPLPPSIKLRLQANYTRPDSVMFIEQEILNYDQVSEVVYKKTLIYAINENIRKISLIILGFSTLLALVAITLINNTIRLSIYSKRFIINTMQLVGATRNFIKKPFLLRSVFNSLLSSLIAMGLILTISYFTAEELEGILSFNSTVIIVLLGLSLFLISIVINFTSTFFAVNKYLNIKSDKLYY